MRRKAIAGLILIVLMGLLAACRVPGFSAASQPTVDARGVVNTAAAKTIAAMSTDIAAGRNPTVVGPLLATPSFTPGPSQTPAPAATNTPGPDCNRASFVRDATIPDGSTLPPSSTFTKTWEIKNTGTCTWNSGYTVVFAGRGQQMNGQGLPVSGEVKPGDTTKVSVSLRAPGEVGDFESYWMLQSGDKKTFGTGANGAAPFFVKIHVAQEYYFAQHTCSATWSSGAGDLPCPGTEGGSQGFILPQDNPGMEDKQPREGQGWLVMPQPVAGGYIVAKFPAVIVPDHSDFRATISCKQSEDACYVKFKITYIIDNGSEQTLGEWMEGADNNVSEIVEDLNMAAGRPTAFNFYVYVSGSPDRSQAVWFNPRIIKN